MSRIATALVLVLSVAAFAAPAEDDRLAAARTVGESDPERAESLLLSFSGEQASHDDQAAAAKTALDVLPYERGNDVAAALILEVLKEDRSHPDAWQLGYGLRRRVRDGLDVRHGEPFLREMIAIYPDYVRFKYALADLLYGAGMPEEADTIYAQIVQEVPDDTRARYTRALLRELEGNARESLRIYDEIIDRKLDLWAHRYKVKLLWDVLADYDAAETALTAAFTALDAAPPGRTRDEIRAELEWDEKLLASRREERAKLAEADTRTTNIVLGLLAGWFAFLGGGVTLLRRRRLI